MNLEDKVQSIIDDFCSECKSFTSLDVSNKAKQEGFASARHRQIAEIVRRQYDLQVMYNYDYERSLVDVELLNGLATKAYLYHHTTVSPDAYIERKQVAIIPTQADRVDEEEVDEEEVDEEEVDEEEVDEEEVDDVIKKCKSDGRLEIPASWARHLAWAPGNVVYIVKDGDVLIICRTQNLLSYRNKILVTTKITPDGRLRVPKTAFVNANYRYFGEYKITLCDDHIEISDIAQQLPHSTYTF